MTVISDCGQLLSDALDFFLFKGIDREKSAALLNRHGQNGVFAARYDHKEIIFEPHSFKRSIGFILDGCVTAYGRYEKNGGEKVILNTFLKGDVFGAAALFSKAPDYTSTLVSKGKSTVLFLSQTCITSLISESPVIAQNYIAFLSEKIRFLNGKIATFTETSAEDRLYKYLCSQLPEKTGVLTLPISINRLSSWLNIGRASLYRAFESLEQKGLVKKDGRNITLMKIL